MIGESLANDFQYTKLKYKQYIYFSLSIPTYVSFMFHFIQFIYQRLSLFCLFKLILSLDLIDFSLMYYQDNNAEHNKFTFMHTVEFTRFFRKNRKQNKQKYCFSLQLQGCAHYSLLVVITHY